MFTAHAATDAGTPGKANEDWLHVDPNFALVLDGATTRTETGCTHGVPWYVSRLGPALAYRVRQQPLVDALRTAIEDVNGQHPDCDLSHPGTPSAGVAMVYRTGDVMHWLALGDVTIITAGAGLLDVIVDDRVSKTAKAARDKADSYPIGSPEKAQALLEMKAGELAARNRPGGYWIAATEPAAADHALTGHLKTIDVDVIALLSDGAARPLDFGISTPKELMMRLTDYGPASLIRNVRSIEASDPLGERWPRNKTSDDATAVLLKLPWS